MPYTHWAYFGSREQATSCGAELTTQDFLVDISTVDSDVYGAGQWLLLAAKPVPIGHLVTRHDHVEAIVERHGGAYDGGESGWLDTGTGTYLQQESPATPARPDANVDARGDAPKIAADVGGEIRGAYDHHVRLVRATIGAAIAVALAVFSLAGAIRLATDSGPAVIVVEAAALLALAAQLWWLHRTRHVPSTPIRAERPAGGEAARWRHVLVWTCWSTGVLVAGIGPMTTLLALGQEAAAVCWFAVAVLAVILTGPAARRWLERGLGIGGGANRGI